MRIVSVRHIEGPNLFLYKPILQARIHLEELTERESKEFPGFHERLLQLLPGLSEHHCAKGQPGGFLERLEEGTYFGHIVEHVCIELCTLLEIDVHYGKTLYADGPGIYNIVIECKAYAAQKFLLYKALECVENLLQGQAFPLQSVLQEAQDILAVTELGPSTKAILEAAERRDIPVRRIGGQSFLQLGYGRYCKRVVATITDNCSAVAVDIASDKELTKLVLEEAGIPVPRGDVAVTSEEAVQIWERLGQPVVVKPRYGNQGRGVSLDLNSPEEIQKAFDIAAEYSQEVVVEVYCRGQNLRLLCVGGEFAAASLRIPPYVEGDGQRTVSELIEILNEDPLRGIDHERPLTRVKVDEIVHQTLTRQGYSLDSVPQAGQQVWLRESANLSTGGHAKDITDQIHPLLKTLAARTARAVGLDVCGIDIVMDNPLAKPSSSNMAVIEVNAAPGIRMHQYPTQGRSRDVADAIVASLFPDNSNGRIPIVAITGTNGKTTTTRLIAHALERQGVRVGMTTTEGVYINGVQVMSGDTTGPRSARLVLSDPTVDVAVLETARGGICRGGLAYDLADVGVITNITADHLGQDGIDTLEDIVHVKSLVAECVKPTGCVVLNADDERVLSMRSRIKAKTALFSMQTQNHEIQLHLASGGTAYYLNRKQIVEAVGSFEYPIVSVEKIPLTVLGTAKFHVQNCLAATAALRHLGLTRQEVAAALLGFHANQHNTGRAMMYELPNRVRVILDYGHNPHGFACVTEWVKQLGAHHLIGVVGVPGDRADEVVYASSEVLAGCFDWTIVKEDADKRGRQPGEIAKMMAERMQSLAPQSALQIIEDELIAFQTALDKAKAGDMVVAFYEKLEPLLTELKSRQAKPLTQWQADAEQVPGYAMV
ncbi:cyanophycin synthetase [Alicyclobacillus sp. TC]|uniref:Cyanophycin synthetase n=2 Tax=Alicyclobacillus tolerans TaxID=90970 RepID=A0A1M6PHS5_9BACL|nr:MULTISPECIES: cyanophycin synthetase [Alicyclobacillus]MDP9729742.1 cyanophycin synthetase [Alicyclobacillus tengchongensis]QRF22344.1 cyanophycin synthetase [Alicyclobacillus sp. TC]SHK07491.1 cyanophycin synthetase [Alicyclobacillus montanus]